MDDEDEDEEDEDEEDEDEDEDEDNDDDDDDDDDDDKAEEDAMEDAIAAAEEEEGEEDDIQDRTIYETYVSKRIHAGAGKFKTPPIAHPSVLVETAALANIDGAFPDFPLKDSLGPVAEAGLLSDAQLESVVSACELHSCQIRGEVGYRAGFALGDGAGVGKGRQAAALILDSWLRGQFCKLMVDAPSLHFTSLHDTITGTDDRTNVHVSNQGRPRAIWFSCSADLYHDARRDLSDIGGSHIPMVPLGKLKYEPIAKSKAFAGGKGVLFCTYDSLIAKNKPPKAADQTSRFEQITEWFQRDFDGVSSTR